jgi:predicted RecB family endonuclease
MDSATYVQVTTIDDLFAARAKWAAAQRAVIEYVRQRYGDDELQALLKCEAMAKGELGQVLGAVP